VQKYVKVQKMYKDKESVGRGVFAVGTVGIMGEAVCEGAGGEELVGLRYSLVVSFWPELRVRFDRGNFSNGGDGFSEFLSFVKGLGAVWDRESKVWKVPLVYAYLFEDSDARWSEEARREYEDFRRRQCLLEKIKAEPDWAKACLQHIPHFSPTVPLLEHQYSGVLYLLTAKKALLGDEMGLGKTKMTIEAMEILRKGGKLERALIVCPSSTVYSWRREIATHAPSCASSCGDGVVLLVGSKSKRLKALSEGLRNGGVYFVINYEGMLVLGDELGKHRWDAIVLDECHRIKNPQAQTTKKVMRLKSPFQFALSGTPTGDKPLDVWSVLKWLCPTLLPSYWDFRKRYCLLTQERATGGHMYWKILGYKNLGELKSALGGVSIRRRKEEVLDLPPKVYQRCEVELSGEQLKAYRAVVYEVVKELEQMSDRDWDLSNPLAKLTRLSQVADHVGFLFPERLMGGDVDPKDELKMSAKLGLLVDLVSDLLEQVDHGVVIWSRFNFVIQRIVRRLEGMCRVAGYYGVDSLTNVSMSPEERDRVAKDFREGKLDVVVVNPKAGGVGVEFTPADVEVFFDRTFSRLEMIQAEDRCHRLGMNPKGLLVIDLVAQGTVDELAYDLLHHKNRLATALLGEAETLKSLGKEKVVEYLRRGR
jgi:SNF2 family DNA or RNA helicase